MLVTWQRRVVIEALPNVTVLDTVDDDGCARFPIKVLLEPIVKLLVPVCPAAKPIAVLELPVVTVLKAL